MTTNCNVQQPNFKGHYIVKIAKSAFKSPENYQECSKLFGKEMDKYTRDKMSGIFSTILAFFTTRFHKAACMLENSSFRVANEAIKKTGYSLSWFRQNTGLPIKDAAEKGYHTFDVYTKNEKEKIMDALKKSIKNIKSAFTYTKEGSKKYPNDKVMATAYAQTKIAIDIDKYIEEAIKDVPVKDFRIETLEDLKGIVEKMEY